jgi:hypothetical protein
MEQVERSRKGKHLTRDERMVLERMSRGGYPPRDIAADTPVAGDLLGVEGGLAIDGNVGIIGSWVANSPNGKAYLFEVSTGAPLGVISETNNMFGAGVAIGV